MEWAVKTPIWEGETVYIVGGGPSVEKLLPHIDRLQNVRTIAVKNVVRFMPWADLCFWMDCKWINQHDHRRLMQRFCGFKVTVCDTLKDERGIRFLKRNGRSLFDLRPEYLSCGNNSGQGAISLAVKLGATKVVLFGFDMSRDEKGRSNYDTMHDQVVSESVYATMFIPSMTKFAEVLRQRKVEVLNATPGSALRCFPIVDPMEVLNGLQ